MHSTVAAAVFRPVALRQRAELIKKKITVANCNGYLFFFNFKFLLIFSYKFSQIFSILTIQFSQILFSQVSNFLNTLNSLKFSQFSQSAQFSLNFPNQSAQFSQSTREMVSGSRVPTSKGKNIMTESHHSFDPRNYADFQDDEINIFPDVERVPTQENLHPPAEISTTKEADREFTFDIWNHFTKMERFDIDQKI